ncbi:unnamed protein product [Rangifer tarandus platyrhynchus]|uniref:Uncharacterized protein n=1 Tax=Rangifer tarandus platyrhynchus TaxID=3082113 RepID=A0AC59ZUY2_RANTA
MKVPFSSFASPILFLYSAEGDTLMPSMNIFLLCVLTCYLRRSTLFLVSSNIEGMLAFHLLENFISFSNFALASTKVLHSYFLGTSFATILAFSRLIVFKLCCC